MTKPAEPSLDEQRRYTCKAEAALQFHGWHAAYAPYAMNAADAVVCKELCIFSFLIELKELPLTK